MAPLACCSVAEMARFLAWLDKTARHGGGYETPGSQVGAGLKDNPAGGAFVREIR